MTQDARYQRGLSLAEVLVAVTVMAIAGTVALFLYDASRKSFQKGENATEQQQAVRIAFDELSKDLRLAGFNYNPDGEDDDPDEPIEAAYDTAVVIRADFDAEDPTRSGTPEDTLAGGAHGAVSVGNDEIVAYVLANDSSRDTLRFEADVKDVPRDGIVETVEIPNVALVQSNPPYTLYRITLKEASDWGGASFVTRTPLVDDVYSMTFKYSGVEGSLGAVGGADTPAARSTRGEIRRIDVALKGLTHDPDLTWADPNDTNPATRSHRKFLLSGAVTPRNLGKKGMQDLGPGVGGGRTLGWDTTPPQKPGPPTLVVGHCDGLYITWPSNPPADRVAAYRVNYGTISGRPNAHRTLAATATYLSGLTNATNYYVTVQATDAAGNWSVPSDEQSAVTTNASTPKAPGGVVASLDRDDGVRLTWTAVTQNTTSDPTADPYSPGIRDLEGYQIWRGPNDSYKRSDPGVVMVADETMVGPLPSPSYLDTDVVPCRNYYYEVVAFDFCGSNNDTGKHTLGKAVTTVKPMSPQGVKATDGGGGAIRVVWEPVLRDVNGRPIFIDNYEIDRAASASGPPADCSSYSVGGSVRGVTEFQNTYSPPPGQTAYYRVRALDDCNNVSDCSVAASPCPFSGSVRVGAPGADGTVRPPVFVEAQIQGGSDRYTRAILEFRNEADGSAQTVVVPGSGPWTYNWTPASNGKYLIKATVENDQGSPPCSSFATIRVTVRP